MVVWGTPIKISPQLKTIPSFVVLILVSSWWTTSPGSWPWLFWGRRAPDSSWVNESLFSGIWKFGWLRNFSLFLDSWNCQVVGSGWQTYVPFYHLEAEKTSLQRERALLVTLALLPVHPEVQLGSCPWSERTLLFSPPKASSSPVIFLKLAWWVTGICSQQTPDWQMRFASGPWPKKVTGAAHSNQIELRL